MFDITPEDISQLNDIDLRELVGRLCEAELLLRGLSPAAVTWGGNQAAPDGGLDVRVALPPDMSIDGFIPRCSTGFQVKVPDMPRNAIISEMRPAGAIRPVIQELAHETGAYVIVSSKGSTSDVALRNRRLALRDALDGVADADDLHTDFYDRTRLATWVRLYPGLITWVKERVGRALVGWRPYGPWSGSADGVGEEYMLDDKLRLHLGGQHDTKSVADAIDEFRDELAQPRRIVRLIGLSGVGKTRLVQALFDARIGLRALPTSLAVYTNLSDNPDPQPCGLASDLIANRTRAVLIVDNCPPDLHHRLAELCRQPSSMVSVLTVEYDVRDDRPEGTHVVALDTSSPELIEKLVRRRYPQLSQVDALTIAEAAGGNSRIAIALAETVGHSDTIAGLSNDELFQRLFHQRQDPDGALLIAAQACSLVYSFHGEATGAELPHLALLADQPVVEIYRHVSELLRRDLAQQRGVWRAVLPHALANRLAARALDDTPFYLISLHLVETGNERLARSFSRRLSFLHDHRKTAAIVERWLAPNGILGDVTALNACRHEMFENVAPVLPRTALSALEQAGNSHPDIATKVWLRHRLLLRSLAYDPALFERSAEVLARAATQSADQREANEASATFVSLFTLYLSGTHATIEQRLGVIEPLVRSDETKAVALGLAALDKALKTADFSSSYRFEFGARSRDHGYQPRSRDDVARWYGAVLSLIERLALTEGILKIDLLDRLARSFPGLWTLAVLHDDLERLFSEVAAQSFWREGWVACRRTMRFRRGNQPLEAASRLSALEIKLRPSTLPERVRAMIFGSRINELYLEDSVDVEVDPMRATERLDELARDLGAAVAADDAVFTELLPDLVRGGHRAYAFGRGLAVASPDRRATWARLVEGVEQLPTKERRADVFSGFLAELWERNRDLAQSLLDSALNQPALLGFLPILHSTFELDERSVERLKRALNGGQVPIRTYAHLAHVQTTRRLTGGVLRDLLLLIADQPDGFDVALNILQMRLLSDRTAPREPDAELLATGRELLRRIVFHNDDQNEDYERSEVVRACLADCDAGLVAADVAMRLRRAVETHETSSFANESLLTALLEVQPVSVLDALLAGDEEDLRAVVELFRRLDDGQSNPADVISCETLIAWCEGDQARRYPLAASIITFSRRPAADAPLVWSEQAKALLVSAAEPRSVVTAFIKRFRPTTWSGSYASLLEANVRLLESLGAHVPSALMRFVSEVKAKLELEVANGRQLEARRDRERDERFE